MTLAVVVCYLAVVLGIGIAARTRRAGPDRAGEAYFLAGRSIGPFILLMTLFGTNMSAFTILGASGEAYRQGFRVFALMATSTAIVVPATFLWLGVPLWRLGKRFGYATQSEFLRDRYGSGALGFLVLGAALVWQVPYVVIGVKGGGNALAAISAGGYVPPPWLGSLVLCLVILIYVVSGGMRSTAVVNTFQTLVFMSVGAISFWVITEGLGSLEAAATRLAAEQPQFFQMAPSWRDWTSIATYVFVLLSVACFPHIFSHWMSARSERAFRPTVIAYPICVIIVWLPSVVLGALGRLDIAPDTPGPVIILLIQEHAGALLAGCLAAGIFAAIMSSLDSQTLAVATMLTRDVVRRAPRLSRWSGDRQALVGRALAAGFLVVVFVVSLVSSQTLFSLGVWALSGFAGLFPVFVAAIYWRRSTAVGAIAGILAAVGLWTVLFIQAEGAAGWSVGDTGVEPAAVIVLGSAAALVLGSLLSQPPPSCRTARFFTDPAGRPATARPPKTAV